MLPASVQEIADVIGREAALFLVGQLPTYARTSTRDQGAQWRETIMYVPKTLKPDHILVRILGWPNADKLVKHFGGEILKPANCRHLYRAFRDKAITTMLMDGQKVAHVAVLMGVSDRHVRNLQREIPREGMQAANDNNRTR